MSAQEIVRRTLGIVEIAVAGEDVRAAVVVVVVVGVVGAVEGAAVVTAAGMVATAAAEGIKPRIEFWESQNPHPFGFAQGKACRTKRDKGGAPEDGELRIVRGSFFWEEFAQVSRKCSRRFRGAQERMFLSYGILCSGRGKFAHSGCECS